MTERERKRGREREREREGEREGNMEKRRERRNHTYMLLDCCALVLFVVCVKFVSSGLPI